MYTCIGDTQLQSQQSPGEEDDLAVELEKMLNEYDEEKAAQTEAPEPDAWSWQGCRDDDCSQYQEWQSKHWSSQTWSEWSWDRWDSHSGWPHRSWSHESEMSWKQEDWTKEISRGHSADLQPGLQSAAAGASDAEKMQSMLHRLPTSMDDQVRGPAPMMDQKGDKHGPPTAQRDNPDPKQDPATDPTKQQQQQQPMDTEQAESKAGPCHRPDEAAAAAPDGDRQAECTAGPCHRHDEASAAAAAECIHRDCRDTESRARRSKRSRAWEGQETNGGVTRGDAS